MRECYICRELKIPDHYERWKTQCLNCLKNGQQCVHCGGTHRSYFNSPKKGIAPPGSVLCIPCRSILPTKQCIDCKKIYPKTGILPLERCYGDRSREHWFRKSVVAANFFHGDRCKKCDPYDTKQYPVDKNNMFPWHALPNELQTHILDLGPVPVNSRTANVYEIFEDVRFWLW